jgi:enoyl-CoA hydratase
MGLITYETVGRVARIGLNRPEKLNALNEELIVGIRAATDRFSADETARVAILHGLGRSFSVGFDLSRPAGYLSDVANRERLQRTLETWLHLWRCPKPIIAQVHGYCLAGATHIPICCDVTIVADDALFGWPRLPLGGGLISPVWAWVVGVQRAKLMSYRVGSTITAREAHEWGYASLIYPAAELAERTLELAQEMALLPSELLRIKKLANNRVAASQGFEASMLAGAEWDTIAHTTGTVHEIREWIKDLGLKGAIDKFKREGL